MDFVSRATNSKLILIRYDIMKNIDSCRGSSLAGRHLKLSYRNSYCKF
jgi:hypothetical protein